MVPGIPKLKRRIMKRRKFLQATTMLPFFPYTALEKEASGENSINNENILRRLPDNDRRDFFYRPVNGWVGDVIPFYANGEFQLFYLLDWRDKEKHGEGIPWYRITTTDFVNFKEHGEAIPAGRKEDQDMIIGTGSVIKANGQYHIFYTGINAHLRQQGKPEQAVMHAVSDDMNQWRKLPEHTFFAPGEMYEPHDWRDPFVFWNGETNEYNMLVCARFKKGISRRRGVTAFCVSKDLTKWEVKDPFYAPALYFAHECPDLFKMGDWWYLLFSEFTDLVQTRYRMSRSLNGPWIIPERDNFDGHAFYAAKTATDGKRRFIFGWNPTRKDSKDADTLFSYTFFQAGYTSPADSRDFSTWDWAGNLVVHEIQQEKNGELTVRVPQTVTNAFSNPVKYAFTAGAGNFHLNNGVVNIKAPGTFEAAVAGKMPDTCKIKTIIEFEKNTRECGLMLRSSNDLDKAYYIRLEPKKNRLVFDMWPRYRSEVDHMVELERDIALAPATPVVLEVFIDGNKGVAYVNNTVAMNFRAYDMPEGNWGVFVTNGNATFSNMSISSL